MQPHKNDAMMDEAEPINEFAKVLVLSNEDCLLFVGSLQHEVIVDTRLHFSDIPDYVAVVSQLQDDLLVHTFIGEQIHAAGSAMG